MVLSGALGSLRYVSGERWNVPRKCGPHGELYFFFFVTREPIIHEATDDEHGRSLTDEEGEYKWRTLCCALLRILRAAR